MKKVVKVNFMLVLAAMFTFGFMSFKLVHRHAPSNQWHTIAFNDPDDEDDDVIGGTINQPDEEIEDCSTLSSDEYRCAIRLTYDPMLFNPEGSTVSEAADKPEVTAVGPRAYSEEPE